MKIEHLGAPSLVQLVRAMLNHHAKRLAVAPAMKDVSKAVPAIVYVELTETLETPYLVEFLAATITMTERPGQDRQNGGDFYLDDPISRILDWLNHSEWRHVYFHVPIAGGVVAHVVMCIGAPLVKRINYALMTAGMPDSLANDAV